VRSLRCRQRQQRDRLGIGLSISRAVIAAHDGRLWAENNPDRGATFYFAVRVGQSNPDN